MDHACEYCGAQYFYPERAKNSQPSSRPKYSLCCLGGKVDIPPLKKPPKLLSDLLEGLHEKSRHFKDHIRVYNSMLAFTSMTGEVDKSVHNSRGPPSFKIKGNIVHRIGSLLPGEGQRPRFSQLYIYDTQNEVQNRINAFRYYLGFIFVVFW